MKVCEPLRRGPRVRWIDGLLEPRNRNQARPGLRTCHPMKAVWAGVRCATFEGTVDRRVTLELTLWEPVGVRWINGPDRVPLDSRTGPP